MYFLDRENATFGYGGKYGVQTDRVDKVFLRKRYKTPIIIIKSMLNLSLINLRVINIFLEYLNCNKNFHRKTSSAFSNLESNTTLKIEIEI